MTAMPRRVIFAAALRSLALEGQVVNFSPVIDPHLNTPILTTNYGELAIGWVSSELYVRVRGLFPHWHRLVLAERNDQNFLGRQIASHFFGQGAA